MAGEKIKIRQSYVSLLLGLAVVVVVVILLVSFIRGKKGLFPASKEPVLEQVQKTAETPQIYTVVEGDTLGSIAEKIYQSRDRWADIARFNSLANPDLLFIGAKLKLPKIEPENPQISSTQSTITQESYTVKTGDYLWDIAVRSYGDGFRWEDIAKENNLGNPDVVEVGTVLKIPR
ncbi:MAG: LysM peptidoglycan-binding domain-containing protein [Candidatus Levybacteria bacterium]|nr:LysM peptidoglycan-binding domain-containing protein [Candidatus Levybacteria bacterium]